MLIDSIKRNSGLLTAFALCTAGLLATTYVITKKPIAASQRAAAQKALLEIIPIHRHSNDMLMDTWDIPASEWDTLGLQQGGQVHIARDDTGRPTAIITPSVATDGYSGDIRLLVGVDSNGQIEGVRVVEHKETPGLGDKVDVRKSRWILSFDDRSLNSPTVDGWHVKKDGGDFDQFTGATITPRAVVEQVRRTLEFFQRHQDEWFSAVSSSTPSPSSSSASTQGNES